MFKSDVRVADLIGDLKNEVDIAVPIPNHTYVEWLNSLEQLLYGEIIREQKEFILENPETVDIAYEDMDVEGQGRTRFEDVVAVFVNDVQLIKTSVLSGKIFANCYYKKDEDNLGLNLLVQPEEIEKIRVVYRPRPTLKKTEGNDEIISDDDYVMLPVEFVDLARAKLRGEAYKLANEDLLAAKWLNEYNVLLDNFRVWVADKQSTFGL